MKVAELCEDLLARKGQATPSAAGARAPAPLRRVGIDPQAKIKAELEPDRRAKVSLRLGPAQHRRLRMAAARLDCAQQDILERALASYLDSLEPKCPCLAGLREVRPEAAPEDPPR